MKNLVVVEKQIDLFHKNDNLLTYDVAFQN